MAAGAVSLKNLTKYEEVRKLEKELIRLYVFIQVRTINSQGITFEVMIPKLLHMIWHMNWQNCNNSNKTLFSNKTRNSKIKK